MKTLTTLIASGLISCALLGFAQPVQAESTAANDAVFAALRDYAQSVGAEAKLVRAEASGDGVYSQLLGYAEQVGESASDASSLRGMVKEAAKAAPKAAAKAAPGGDAYAVGSQVCRTCHAAKSAEFDRTVMGKIGKVKKGTMECENCHGPGSAHVKAGGGRGVGGLVSFRLDDHERTVEENNAVCLACHERGDRTYWKGSNHELHGVACSNCHTVMTNVTAKFQLAKLTEMDTCFQCHKNKRAEIWRSSHMPLREGKMTCSNCHNPHGTANEFNLREATINDTCYKCHAEKRGPFLWEHPPVREDCLNCHDAHGSNNDFLLKISRPRLCQQCHAGGQHNSNPRNPLNTLYAQVRECQNCHSAHHGSNSPAGARFMR